MYTLKEGKELIGLARQSIRDAFSQKETIIPELVDKYKVKQGVFVTLKINGELRGCIGFVLPHYSLYDGVVNCSRSAAFEDPRFISLTEEEFRRITIDVSVLSVPKEIKVKKKEELLEKIKIGRDGLIIKKGMFTGLLLPQVFVEWKADAKKALEMTAEKAGLSPDAWKDDDAVIESFQAQVFVEDEKGNVEEEKLG